MIDNKIKELSESISGQMDAHLIESIISLFNSGVLVHYVRTPRSTFDQANCKLSIDAASGVRFEGREKLIKLEKENEKLKHEIEVLRNFGNKDCTAMADSYLSKEAK